MGNRGLPVLFGTPRKEENKQVNALKATQELETLSPSDLLPYKTYFDTITPTEDTEVFRRGLFAFASVHTTWRYNVDMFAMLWDLGWTKSRQDLRDRIFESRAGLTDGRTRAIWEFNENYWKDPSWYRKRDDELWPQYRDRVQARTLGLGFAKTAFFIELCYPLEAEVLVTDTHVLQMYGLKGNSAPGAKLSGYIEGHWVAECRRLKFGVPAARWCLWDRKQGQTDSRYWSYCIEGGQPSLITPRQLELFTWKETIVA